MITAHAFLRETKFLLRQPFALGVIAIAGLLASLAVWGGLSEGANQRAEIRALLTADAADRNENLAKQSDYGSAAYYSFHLTYDPPSELAFAAMGERDTQPWKHRIRMLALEGQIYESDAGNAELAQAGRFDYAFVIAILAPLFLILLLHDQRASERMAGRHDLLIATGGNRVWVSRAIVRIALLGVALITPFVTGAMIAGAPIVGSSGVVMIVFAQLALWSAICLWASARNFSGPAIASGLIAAWLATTFVIPAASDAVIEAAIETPEGGEILMAQREAVNDAWDLPKEATMKPFLERHPEWTDTAPITRPFEWKWYYAFQQVGDQTVEDLSLAYREAVAKRNAAADFASLLSPAALTTRAMTSLAGTDRQAALAYRQRVRRFHHDLRMFFYPLMFGDASYDATVFESLPSYEPDTDR